MKKRNIKEIFEILNGLDNNLFYFNEKEVESYYKNSKTKIPIICRTHAQFLISIECLLRGQRCHKCAIIRRNNNRLISAEDIIQRIHKICECSNYSFDVNWIKNNYKDTATKVPIICSIHGTFWTNVHNFTKHGCEKCGKLNCAKKLVKSSKILVEELTSLCEFSNYLFDSEEVIKYYKKASSKIPIICKIHGKFLVSYNNFNSGKGCRKCKDSKGENTVRFFLLEHKIAFQEQKSFTDCKFIKKLRFDFYLEWYKILLEFQGSQHFKFSKIFHKTEEKFNESIWRDEIKRRYCKENSIKLIEIDSRIYNNKEKIENYLKEILL